MRGVQFELVDHEGRQGLATIEAQIAGQCTQVVEKPFAWQELADALVAGVHQHGVKHKGQEMAGGQQGGEMLFAVAEVVGQVVALGFQGVVVFVLPLSARAPVAYPVGDGRAVIR
jgi:hypothetical protein